MGQEFGESQNTHVRFSGISAGKDFGSGKRMLYRGNQNVSFLTTFLNPRDQQSFCVWNTLEVKIESTGEHFRSLQ